MITMSDKQLALVDLFRTNNWMVNWVDTPMELQDTMWQACQDGIVISDGDVESYFMQPFMAAATTWDLQDKGACQW